MKILLTNDDGIYAEGLWALQQELALRHSVSVVAPDRERTAVGHGITLHSPLRVHSVSMNGSGEGLAVNGTPADCVKLGVLELLATKPDIVISGINQGANVGININYSGTVSAAREAALYGLPAIAVSAEKSPRHHLAGIAVFITDLAEKTLEKGLPFGTILNVNFPGVPMDRISGVRVSSQSISLLGDYYEKRNDPRNRPYYWPGCDTQCGFVNPDSDGAALKDNYISITPIKCDMTDYGLMDDLKTWNIVLKSNQ
jgi:5'-nucleotidase